MEGYPLTSQQRRLWALGDDPAYRSWCTVEIAGDLDRDRMRGACREIGRRHEALRTAVRCWPGLKSPLQALREDMPIAWREVDGTAWEEAELRRALDEWRRTPLDLATGPVTHCTLVELGPGRHVLHLVVPSLLADTVSMRNLFDELVGAYGSGPGPGHTRDDLIQLQQVVEWLNEMAEDEDSAAGREFWHRKLAGGSLPALPYERQAGDGATFLPASEGLELAAAAAVEQRARQLGAPPEAFLLAAWTSLLWRLTGGAEMIVEKIFNGRTGEDLAAVCGPVARALPLRLALAAGLRFHEIVRRLVAESESAWRWQAAFAPPEPRHAPGATLLGGFAFELVDWPPAARAAEVSFTLREASSCLGRFKAKLVCGRREGAIHADLCFDPACLDAAAAQCLLRQLRALLANAISHPDSALAKLRLADEEERRHLIVDFNRNGEIESPNLCVHALFARQAAAHPDALAVVCEDRALTYRELDLRSSRLAQRLRRLGVGPEEPVALGLERSAEMVIGLLGVLKAGGFYVPLDPAWPEQRWALTLGQLGAPVVVVQEALRGRLPGEVTRTVVLDAADDAAAGGPWEDPGAVSSQLACVLFTSGSTGRPKGVAIEHRQLVSYVMALRERLGLPADASFATVSTFAADLGNTAVFSALCLGGCLHVISRDRMADAERFAAWLAARPVDCLKIAPSHLAALLNGADPRSCLPRRLLVLGGETPSWQLIERVQQLAPACRIVSEYGATETTVGAMAAALDAGAVDRAASPSLGRPLAHAQIYLLGSDGEAAPCGVAGEIFIGGSGLARGYFGSPELTAERFLPDPFAAQAGGRLYRSGDLARHLPSGGIEFLGRLDQQVDIRGLRVELARVESALRQHHAVHAAAVVLRGDPPAERRLVAYVVARRGHEAPLRELQELLRERLPEHMVPAAFVPLATLPLTPNGKLDRAALPTSGDAESDADRVFEPPSTPLEETIAGLWQELLGVPRVARNDNFFELGGHSLLATLLFRQLRELCGVDLRFQQLLEAPTVAALAARVLAAQPAGKTAAVPPVERTPRPPGRGLPLSFGQHRLWLAHQLDADGFAYNIPSGMRVSGPLVLPWLAQSVSDLVQRHEMLRTTFQEIDGEPVQVIGAPAQVSIPLVDLGALPERARDAETGRVAAVAARTPFDLAAGPLWRVLVVRLGADLHAVVFAVHHIASDAWSATVLVREVIALYEAAATGRPSGLPDLPIQYADFAAWQRQWQRPEALPAEVEFWRRQLGGELPVLDLADRPRPPVMTHRGASLAAVFGDELLQQVRALSRAGDATSFHTLLAMFAVVLSHHGGCRDVLIGTNVLGRDQPATGELIGFHLNMVVVRIDLAGEPSFQELLRRVRDTALTAYAHQDLPFDQLVEVLKPKRDPARHPIFQVIVDYQRLPPQRIAAGGLTFTPLELEFDTAHCDLTLFLKDTEDALHVHLGYNADLLTATRARRVLADFEAVLRRVLAAPEIALGDLYAALAARDEHDRKAGEQEFRAARRRQLLRVAGRAAVAVGGTEMGS
jgi:amino acid adenylation domain-containing protein